MPDLKYPIAPNGIFDTVQGEGLLSGEPTTFVRLAGCSVGCPQCDTDYRVAERLTVAELVERLQRLPYRPWVWLTGGEPTDHDVAPLVAALQAEGRRVALATSGVREATRGGWRVHAGRATGGVDFLSVSPHDWGRWAVRGGTQLNVVPGLNGLSLADMPAVDMARWTACYVTPCTYRGRPEGLRECVAWVQAHPGWRLGVQAHKLWGLA